MQNLKGFLSIGKQEMADFASSLLWGFRHVEQQENGFGEQYLESLRRDGFVVIPNYYAPEKIALLKEKLLLHVGKESQNLESGAYIRNWGLTNSSAYDRGVFRIYHVDKLVPELSEFRFDKKILSLVSSYYKKDFHAGLLMYQHNEPNKDTRGFHIDAFSKQFKAFLYLDKVTIDNGPFTYIRGSHANAWIRARRQLTSLNLPSTSFPDDWLVKYKDAIVQLCADVGTLILADVRGLHRGAPQKSGSRNVLVNYIEPYGGDFVIDY